MAISRHPLTRPATSASFTRQRWCLLRSDWTLVCQNNSLNETFQQMTSTPNLGVYHILHLKHWTLIMVSTSMSVITMYAIWLLPPIQERTIVYIIFLKLMFVSVDVWIHTFSYQQDTCIPIFGEIGSINFREKF